MREKFSGYTVGVGVILYMFFTYGFANVISVAMGVLPQYYNVDISSVVLTCSASSIAAFATSAFVHRFIKKFTPRGTLVVGAFCWLAYCWFIGFSNNIIFMYMAQIVSGFALGCCMHASCSIIIMNWFIEKRGRMISLCMSAGTFGGSLMIYISGVLLPILGVSRFFIYSGIVLCAVCLFCAIVLVKNDPAAVGQKALGWEKAQNIQHDGDIKNNTASSPISSQKNLFSSKKFWMFAIGVVFAMSSISYIGLYTTTVLPMHGIDFSKASALFSILTLGGALFTIISGFIVEKMGVKALLILSCIGGFFANMAMILWIGNQSAIFILILFTGYLFAVPLNSISNQLAGPVFGSRSSEAAAKLTAFSYFGGVAISPAVSKLIPYIGYTGVYTIGAVFSILVLILFFSAMKVKD